SSFSFSKEVSFGVGIGTNGLDTDFASDSSIPIAIEAKGESYILRGGIEINKFFDIDIVYQSYGNVEFSSPLEPNSYKWSPKSISTNLGVFYPITHYFEPFLSFGFGYIDLNENKNLMISDSGFTFKYGLGFKSKPLVSYPFSITFGYSSEEFEIESKSQISNRVEDFSLNSFY
ncbi:porin family protein, partial [Vibrio alginolyticus]|uniref:porin family protein n=1 Tax=Vibrio alginolyticus TaxID=663 RepID=UPI00215D413F